MQVPNIVDRRSTARFIAVMFGLVLPTFVTWIYFSLLANHPASVQKFAYGIGKTIQFGLPCLCLWYFGHWISIKDVPKFGKSVWLGIGSGLLISAAIYMLYSLILLPQGFLDGPKQQIQSKLDELQISTAGMFILIGIGYSIVHSLLEEYYWRWFIFGNLKSTVAGPVAYLVSSVGFAAHHVIVLARYFGWDNPWTYLGTAGVAIGGLVWAFLYQKTSTLLGSWISHGLVDATIFLIGYQIAFG